MAELTFYGLGTCDTCKKALTALKAAGHHVHVVDVRADGVAIDVLKVWLTDKGPEVLVNRRSTTWRGLSDAQKDQALAGDAAALLVEHPTLMKRPVIVGENGVTVGWDKTVQASLL